MKTINTKGELLTNMQAPDVEVLLEKVRTLLTDSLEDQDKSLVILKNLEKFENDSSDLKPENEDTEEELRNDIPEVRD